MRIKNQFKGVNSRKFHSAFSNDKLCLAYLAELKWNDGYSCRKSWHDKFYKSFKPHSHRCMNCKYDESPTANTMFDKFKFSIQVAFHIAFKINTKKKDEYKTRLEKVMKEFYFSKLI